MLEKNPKPKLSKLKDADLPEILANSAIHRKYHLGSVINRDFAGVLYAISHPLQDSREMAVKVLSEGYASSGSSLGNIEHSRICRIRNIIIERDTIRAVIHEKPAGKSLSAHLKASGPLPPGEAVLAELQLLSAVHAVHWHGAVVGNLHADSIFLSRDKGGNLEVQLANLGVVCTDESIREQDYLAPEQIMGGKVATVRSDIWAAGVILYEMLLGRRPFVGENRFETAGAILLKELSFKGYDPKIPESLLDVVRRALDKDERDRYENVSEMVADLMPFQTDFNVPMSEAAATAIHDSVPPAKKDDAQQGSEKPKPRISAKAIPTVRISHTPSYPPVKTAVVKEADPEAVDRARPAMKTKLGMPAISIPPKHIPLKSKDDTATFATQKRETPLDLTAYTARKKRSDATETPNSPAHVAADSGPFVPSAPPPVSPKTLTQLGRTATRIMMRVKSRVQRATAAEKKIALAAGGGFVVALLLITLLSGGNDTASKAPSPSPSPVSTVENKSAAAPSPALQTVAAPEAAATPTPEIAAEVPKAEPEKVDVTIKGKLPKNAVIQAGGAVMDSKVFSLEAGNDPIEILVTADGFEDFVTEIVPSENTTLKVTMRKLRGKALRAQRAQKSKAKKKEKSDKGLASNPFGD